MTVPKIWNAGEKILHADLNVNFQAIDTSAAVAAATGTTNGTAISTLQAKVAGLPTNPATVDQDMGARRLFNVAQGTASTDPARLDQVTWRTISRFVIPTPQLGVVVSLPIGYNRFRLDLEAISPSSGGFPYINFSFNGGLSYSTGPSDYAWVMIKADTSLTQTYANGSTLVQIGPTGLTSGQSGWLEFTPDDKTVFATYWGSGSMIEGATVQGRCNVAGTPTHILFAVSGGSINSGRVRLSGVV